MFRRAAVVIAAVMALAAASAAANAVVLCGYAGCELFILGPHTPNPRSSPHMSFHIHPSKVTQGTGTLHAKAHGFLSGEYVTIWDFWGKGWKHSTQLPGGNATGKGALSFDREAVVSVAVGKHKICLQGERSHRVACATYRVLSADPAVGPGYVAPGSGSGSSSGSGSTSSGSGSSGFQPPTVGPGVGT